MIYLTKTKRWFRVLSSLKRVSGKGALACSETIFLAYSFLEGKCKRKCWPLITQNAASSLLLACGKLQSKLTHEEPHWCAA